MFANKTCSVFRGSETCDGPMQTTLTVDYDDGQFWVEKVDGDKSVAFFIVYLFFKSASRKREEVCIE